MSLRLPPSLLYIKSKHHTVLYRRRRRRRKNLLSSTPGGSPTRRFLTRLASKRHSKLPVGCRAPVAELLCGMAKLIPLLP